MFQNYQILQYLFVAILRTKMSSVTRALQELKSNNHIMLTLYFFFIIAFWDQYIFK